jgi:hypothetical protein
MFKGYYGDDEENVKRGIRRVRKSVRLHDFNDERERNDDQNDGCP